MVAVAVFCGLLWSNAVTEYVPGLIRGKVWTSKTLGMVGSGITVAGLGETMAL